MAKTTAPLLSFGAAGQIGKTQVYATWKGRSYARRYVIPANPNTSGQQATRSTFSWLNDVWRYMTTDAQEAWTAYGVSSRFTNRNGFIKQNLAGLIGEADLTNFIFSPSANGGIPAASMVITPGAGQLSVALTPPSLPAGWTIVQAVAAAIRQQDPQTGELFVVSSAIDATDPYACVITGLTAAQVYVVGGWFKYLKSPGNYAYGVATMDTATPT